jgi:hypothetical protein
MKSERRHELQRNVLEVEIRKVGEFLRHRGNLLAWIGLGAAAIILGIVWYVRTTRSDTEQLQAQFDRSVLPSGRGQSEEQRQAALEKIASDKSHPLWAANADIALGDALALRLATQWGNLSEGDRAGIRAGAQAYYKRAISDFPKEATAVAKAHFGLGKLAEDWGEVDAARKEYEEALAGGEELRGQPIAYVIQESLGRLSQFQGTVNFPASAPSSRPSTQLGTSPSTQASQPAGDVAPATMPIGAIAPAPVPGSLPAAPAAAASAPAPASMSMSAPAKSD